MCMTNKEKDDLFYVCSLIEYLGRKTKNKRKVIVEALGEDGVEKQLHDASVNHCLSFEQVSDEIIEYYHIQEGGFDTVARCKYSVPSVTSIGKLYQQLILSCSGRYVFKEIKKIFSSFISDEISNFNTNVYYSNLSYLKASYEEGRLLE